MRKRILITAFCLIPVALIVALVVHIRAKQERDRAEREQRLATLRERIPSLVPSNAGFPNSESLVNDDDLTAMMEFRLLHTYKLAFMKDRPWPPSDAHIAKLYFRSSPLTDKGIRQLAELPGLEVVNVEGCPNITARGVLSLYELSGTIKQVIFSKSLIDAELADFLITTGRMEGLISIYGKTGESRVDFSGTRITDAELRSIDRITGMKALMLNNTKVSGAGLKWIKDKSQLQELSMRKSELSDRGMAPLSEFGELGYLDIRDTKISRDSLHLLDKLKKLRKLSIDARHVSDAWLESQIRRKKLHVLSRARGRDGSPATEDSQIFILDLGHCPITDEGLSSLRELENLRQLYLDDTLVTEKGLPGIVTLKNLRSAYLGNTKVGLSAVQAFAQAQQSGVGRDRKNERRVSVEFVDQFKEDSDACFISVHKPRRFDD